MWKQDKVVQRQPESASSVRPERAVSSDEGPCFWVVQEQVLTTLRPLLGAELAAPTVSLFTGLSALPLRHLGLLAHQGREAGSRRFDSG